MKFLLGLTGSIGMGKTTAAQIFKDYGCFVWDADMAVADIYKNDPKVIREITSLCPNANIGGQIDKPALRNWIEHDKMALEKLEQIVHPRVKAHRDDFKSRHKDGILVFDIPLLFETGAEVEYDAIACVVTDEKTQKQRVLSRPNMSEHYFEMIKAKQITVLEKVNRSDFVIPTNTMIETQQAIEKIIEIIKPNA